MIAVLVVGVVCTAVGLAAGWLTHREVARILASKGEEKPIRPWGAQELTLEEQVRRGRQAQEILDSEVFRDLLAEIEMSLLQEFKNTSPKEEEKRFAAWCNLQALPVVEGGLRRVVFNGQHAEEVLRLQASL